MKRVFFVFAALASATSLFAQDDAFFKFDKGVTATEVHTLGTNPQFPFLQHQSTPHGVYTAIQRNMNQEDKMATMNQFNDIMLDLGFENGTKDVRESNITAATIPAGTEGNMGSGSMTNGYYKLATGGDVKAWKVTSATGKYIYFLAACGNAFYPNGGAGRTAACITVPVNVTSTPREITVGDNNAAIATDRTYVYYHMKRDKKDESYVRTGIADENPSKPLLLSAKKRLETHPETYKVSVSGVAENATICTDTTNEVAANIDVEKVSAFSGYYPTVKQGYKEVSKRAYKRADRKMRHVEKKEAKIGAITGVPVDIEE